ncbi:MAG: EamA family transporter [Dehalococcoidia bacterium]|nr:MAG: EamA family transporter [Dehalococcoidia bacterium]
MGLHYFLAKLISRHVNAITIAFFTQVLIVVFLTFYIFITNTNLEPDKGIYLWYTLLASILLAVGIITLYMAIQKGPISIVLPIYSLNAIITSVLGILILEETVTIEKVLGIVLAIPAIILLTRR